MSFAKCSSCGLRQGVLWCIVVGVLISLSRHVQGIPGIRVKRSSFFDDDTTIRTEVVDRNNRTIWDMFNLTEAQMSRITAGNNANSKDSSAPPRDSQYFNNIKEYRIKDIRNRLQSAFLASNSEESQDHPLHEMAAYPICNTESNELSWLLDNNVTISFSDSLFEPKRSTLNLDSAILRLYKVNPNATAGEGNIESDQELNQKSKRCADPLMDSQIRITVSIIQQLRRNKRAERKKRICNTIMMNVSKTGWVEIDIRRAILIWEHVERQHLQQTPARQTILKGLLMIEVHDEEERPLKPGLFFKPPKCDQAELAIPWNYYGPQTPMSSYTTNEVPRYPRLDVKLIGYASFAPRNNNKELHQKIRDHIRRRLYNLSSNSEENVDMDSTTSTTPTETDDNLLESSVSTEIQHKHHKRHSRIQRRHHNQHHQQQQRDDTNSQQYVDNSEQYRDSTHPSTSSEDSVESQHHRRQRSHHHHHQHQTQSRSHHHHRRHHQQQPVDARAAETPQCLDC